jgi:zinc protease
VDRVKAVTADQVRDVARKFFVDDHLTVAVLQPLPMTAGAHPPPAGGPPGDLR